MTFPPLASDDRPKTSLRSLPLPADACGAGYLLPGASLPSSGERRDVGFYSYCGSHTFRGRYPWLGPRTHPPPPQTRVRRGRVLQVSAYHPCAYDPSVWVGQVHASLYSRAYSRYSTLGTGRNLLDHVPLWYPSGDSLAAIHEHLTGRVPPARVPLPSTSIPCRSRFLPSGALNDPPGHRFSFVLPPPAPQT